MKKQEPPFAIQIEPVEGCTLACGFCALQVLRDNGADSATGTHGKSSAPFRYMHVDTAAKIAREIYKAEWNPRIEFAMHGEPTAHPDLPLLVRQFRKLLPKVSMMVTTNGSGIKTHAAIENLFESGINTIAFDYYRHAVWKERARILLETYCKKHDLPYAIYPKDKEASPHQRFFKQRVVLIQDISLNTDGTHKITNQGGNSPSLIEAVPLAQRCAKPFRELSFRWDGNVALCCDDWKGQYKIGNINHIGIEEIWDHPRFDAARRALYDSNRSAIQVCKGCDVKTYRNGLLPDKKGNEKMGAFNTAAKVLVTEAQAGENFSVMIRK